MPTHESTRLEPPDRQLDRTEDSPRVSVVIPAHNEAPFIANCIASVLATGWPTDRLEVIVVDHNSTDGTAAVARQTGAIVLSAAPNSKIGRVRNEGLRAATGEFVAFVDGDCTVPRAWLATALMLLRADSEIGAIGGGPALSPAEGTWVERSLAPTQCESGQLAPAITLRTSSFITRTRLLRELGGFNEAVDSGEDDDMSNRIRKRGFKLFSASDCRVIHYGFPNTLSQVVKKEIWHGTNHLDVRTGFDLTLTLTLFFISASVAEVFFLLAALVRPESEFLTGFSIAFLSQQAPPLLYAARKLSNSPSQWSLALPMLGVGYAHFIGHSIGVLRNIYRLLFGRRR